MKKPSYSVAINYIKDHNVESISLTGEAAEAVNGLAHMGQDLRFVYNGNNVVIPWEAVVGVQIQKTMEDVTAPTDSICGGAESGTLEVTLKEDIEGMIGEIGGGCAAAIWPIGYVQSMTLNGEDILDAWSSQYSSDPQSAASVQGATYNENEDFWAYPVDNCEGPFELSVPITYMYNGASVTVTANIYATGNLG